MASKNKSDLFWLSYSDLMTSLFFIMLVLFIVTVSVLKVRLGNVNAEKEQIEQVLKLQEQFRVLSNSSALEYKDENKTFVAKDLEGIEIFKPEDDKIKKQYVDIVNNVGQSLDEILKEIHKQNPDLKYQLVIEGTAAIPNKQKQNHTVNKDYTYAYELSFRRSLALYNQWRSIGIDLRKYNTEILLCGSGFNGINRDNKVEENNKRFVIQIIPKLGVIK